MAERPSFYLDLYSNSSLSYYPGNTLTTFNNQLPQPISLAGGYEVALSEIIFPNNLNAITHGRIIVSVLPDNPTVKDHYLPESQVKPFTSAYANKGRLHFPKPSTIDIGDNVSQYSTPGGHEYDGQYAVTCNISEEEVFTTPSQFIDFLNNVLKGQKGDDDNFKAVVRQRKLAVNSGDKKYPFNITFSFGEGLEIYIRDDHTSLTFDASIARCLGFPLADGEWIRFDIAGSYKFPLQKVDLEASKPHIFSVYTDIISPGFSSDGLQPNLRTIRFPIKRETSLNEYVSLSFNPAHYVPVSVATINTISIKLRDGAGEPVPFIYGLIFIRLHFKPILIGVHNG